jgi:serine acetyltransferase
MFGLAETDDAAFFAHRHSRVARVGHDTWIGHGAIIMPELTIGNGAVVGSGAVVTRDVEPWTIVVGVPAKAVRRRLDPETAAALEAIAWWDWSHEELKERLEDLSGDIGAFVRKYLGRVEP